MYPDQDPKTSPSSSTNIRQNAIFELLARSTATADDVFEAKLVELLKHGLDINAEYWDNGTTVLDTAKMLAQHKSKIEILQRHGAKTGKVLGLKPAGVHDSKLMPYNVVAEDTNALVHDFDLTVYPDLHVVDHFLESNAPEIKTNAGDVSIVRLLKAAKDSIGQLSYDEDMIGTAYLIAPNMIMISRHCLNGTLVDGLVATFSNGDHKIPIAGIIEDGANYELDYAILALEYTLDDIIKPKLSRQHNPPLCLFMGYDSEGDLCFTNFRNSASKYQHIGSHQISYQQTGAGLSGSPYFNGQGEVYAVHQNTHPEHKQALLIDEIIQKHPLSVLQKLLNGEKVAVKLEHHEVAFPRFSNADNQEFDEGRDRGITLGKNPSVAKDQLGKDNLVCQEVLYRWAMKDKARYTGARSDRKEWLKDWRNWEVKVRKSDDAEREWIKLGARDKKGKLLIQMGHKLSATSYWVHGYDLKENPMVSKFFDDYKGDKQAKREKHNARYSHYTKPGFKRVEDGEAIVNRRFMYDASNYRFEFGALNEKNGREESRIVRYGMIFAKGAKLKELTDYRKAKQDRKTTPTLKKELAARKSQLQKSIDSDCVKFTKS